MTKAYLVSVNGVSYVPKASSIRVAITYGIKGYYNDESVSSESRKARRRHSEKNGLSIRARLASPDEVELAYGKTSIEVVV